MESNNKASDLAGLSNCRSLTKKLNHCLKSRLILRSHQLDVEVAAGVLQNTVTVFKIAIIVTFL